MTDLKHKVGGTDCVSCHIATSYALNKLYLRLLMAKNGWRGKAASGVYPVLDLFNMRQFGYYLHLPAISAVKQKRAESEAEIFNRMW